MINMNKFGKIISDERLFRSMTQSSLAKLLLVTPQAVSKWERGESFPDIETFVLLCYQFDINIDNLLNECFESYSQVEEVCAENIEQCLKSSHRKQIISNLLDGKLEPLRITSVFYLFSIYERLRIVEKVVKHETKIDLTEFIILLNPAERIKLLDGLYNNEDSEIQEIIHLLSPIERKMYE